MSPAVQPAVLADGYGARLRPLSRQPLPEQFLPLGQDDIERFEDRCQRA